jgi:hypothetical protein
MRYIYFCFLSLLGFASQAIANETPISVPTDSKAKYFLLEKSESDGKVTIVTKRIGSLGTSYSKRLVDCNKKTFMYLGEGDSLEEMKKSKPDVKMSALTPGSISTYVANAACKK